MAGMEQLPSNLENRIVRYDEAVDPEQLTAHPLNFRRHPVAQRKALRASIEGHGWVAPVIATVDGTVIDGHARVEEALSGGVTVPVVFVDMDDDEAGSMILRMDPIAAMATHDSDVLSELLADEEWTDQEDALREVLDELAATPNDIDDFGDRDSAYTRSIESPVYTIRGDKPGIDTLADTTRRDQLVTKIVDTELPDDVRTFLLAAAERHTVFRFDRIAEYYAHAPAEVQRLMEDSVLVVIDFDKAIEDGFVRMTEQIAELFDAGREDD